MVRRGRFGFTILEMFVTLGLFGLLGTLCLAALTEATTVWRKTSSRDGVARSLTKAWASLRKDLANAKLSPASLEIQKVPGSYGGANGFDGDAVCFLSPVDPGTGLLATKSDGQPFMMRNIIYYCVVPQNHAQLFGSTCSGGADADGYEQQCPHKILVRLSRDQGAASNPAQPASEDSIMTSWTSLLTRPNQLGVQSGEDKIISTQLLTFRCSQVNGLLELDLRAVAIEEASRTIGVGTRPLGVGPYTVQQKTALRPGN